MSTTAKQQTNTARPPIVREYEVGGKKYIVSATTKTGATEDAATKLRRLIRNEILRKDEK